MSRAETGWLPASMKSFRSVDDDLPFAKGLYVRSPKYPGLRGQTTSQSRHVFAEGINGKKVEFHYAMVTWEGWNGASVSVDLGDLVAD